MDEIFARLANIAPRASAESRTFVFEPTGMAGPVVCGEDWLGKYVALRLSFEADSGDVTGQAVLVFRPTADGWKSNFQWCHEWTPQVVETLLAGLPVLQKHGKLWLR